MVIPLDTAADARERQLDALRAMTSSERLRLAEEMSADVRRLAAAGILRRRPDASDEERAELFSDLVSGRGVGERRRPPRRDG